MKRASSLFLICLLAASFFVVLYELPLTSGLDTLIINYDDGTAGSAINKPETLGTSYTCVIGEAFMMVSEPYFLTAASFKLIRSNSPTGNLTARLYAISGTLETDAKPSSANSYQSLANSTTIIAASSLASGSLQWKDFLFDGNFMLEANTLYGIAVVGMTATFSTTNNAQVGFASSNQTIGNYFKYVNAWSSAVSYDVSYRVYGVLAEKLTASNEAYTNNENGEVSTFSSYWVRTGSIDASGYIFSINYGAGYINNTWVAFDGITEVWANLTKTLMGLASQIGNTVYYKTFANASNGKWYESAQNSFVLQATTTFYFNGGGSIERNHTAIANATSTTYTTPTNLTLGALPLSLNGWLSWNISNSLASSTDNVYNYSVVNKTSVWCFFGNMGEGEATEYLSARFSWDIANPEINQNVIFDASPTLNSSAISYYIWFFNSTEINATIPQVTISFETAGIYEVTLQVYSEAYSMGNDLKTQFITVGGGETEGGYSANLLIIFIVVALIIGLLMGVLFVRYKGGSDK